MHNHKPIATYKSIMKDVCGLFGFVGLFFVCVWLWLFAIGTSFLFDLWKHKLIIFGNF